MGGAAGARRLVDDRTLARAGGRDPCPRRQAAGRARRRVSGGSLGARRPDHAGEPADATPLQAVSLAARRPREPRALHARGAARPQPFGRRQRRWPHARAACAAGRGPRIRRAARPAAGTAGQTHRRQPPRSGDDPRHRDRPGGRGRHRDRDPRRGARRPREPHRRDGAVSLRPLDRQRPRARGPDAAAGGRVGPGSEHRWGRFDPPRSRCADAAGGTRRWPAARPGARGRAAAASCRGGARARELSRPT